MARVVKISDVCDVCQNKRRKVVRYRVGQDGTLVSIVLCKEHAAPLEKLLEIGERIQTTAPRAKVWTFEEIEAEKKRQKKNRPQVE